ncbi:MAG: hypothetical protein CGU28_09370 [Candidatus Dactylopiibacterium carminicum]|uniref:Type II secretion system protein N n=1 Tax=Candidatus Dactylopiibacterium carminicum TaxID=857335 RepID=A0A272EQY9_9RHOO|nr:type II secretion system protein N [Candidatus Dactylopiibacterium carminicum]KAF7598700.1 hypothetical protein BGI27_11905 [Candidatus Dactylopiibacterium carminicum]PAS92518.1 MAG: hypothetical protein CGU29_11300 [Candidatus Dactylopiibacterium carminicum]PAS96314.1 MAG: hypothetical protein CGU28_09370 [Candidatus Dactylopiibacterium carminicum]PAS98567.1 MAG: hypothetical protein BSR46_11920 [Candidatus Dactylopiibacterium carminicum]
MSRTLRWSLGLITLLLVLFVARLPAALPARLLPADITLAGLQGSIWHGSAAALGVKGLVTQESLSWALDARALLRGQLAWQIRAEHGGQPSSLRARVGLGGVAVEDLSLRLPVEPFTQFEPTVQGLRLRGDLQLNAQRLVPHQPIGLDARLEQVSSALAGEATALGAYQLRVDIDASGAGTLNVKTLHGPLQANGSGNFTLDGKHAGIDLRLKPEVDLPGLSSALAILPREGDAFRLALNHP